jgi:ABC transporter substrate binding protein
MEVKGFTSAFDPKRTSIGPSGAPAIAVTMARPELSGAAMRRRDLSGCWVARRYGHLPRKLSTLSGVRRIGVLSPWPASDSEGQSRVTAFVQALQQLGWVDGQNIRIDYRLGDGRADTMRKYAAELVALGPDVILASSSVALAPMLEATRTIPIVFVGIADPVAAGWAWPLAPIRPRTKRHGSGDRRYGGDRGDRSARGQGLVFTLGTLSASTLGHRT